MNSMIRQHHLRIPDVKGFLRTFDRHKPLSPDDWAVKESSQYEPGYLIFCLEPVAAPAGLSTFSKRGEDQGETFRVKDLCVIVSKDDGKCVAVIVTPSAYEFRVLDTLLLEKAMKAILDGRDFNYLAARPIQKMDDNALKALYKLGSEYAKGGSRRTLAVEGATLQEPAVALLGQLGAKIGTQVGKQLIDIGSICHMIFTPEGRQEDKSKAVIKSCFVPVRTDEEAGAAAAKPQAMGDSRYSVDPLAEVAHLQDNYSTEAGNIDLSSLAPEPAQEMAFDSPITPFGGPVEPSSSFGDFGMGLLSALAPQPGTQPQAMPYENLSEGGRSSDLPSLPFGEAVMPEAQPQSPFNNMDTLPPSNPSASYSGLSSMDSMPIPGANTSMTGMPAMPMPNQPNPNQSMTNLPPATPNQSMTNMPAAMPNQPNPNQSMTNMPAAMSNQPNPNQSMTNMPAAQAPAPSGNGGTTGAVPAWFIMSHEAIAAPPQAVAPVEQAPAPPPPKEDFSAQFMNDWEQGNAGSAAIDASEKELAQEKQMRTERERGKEQRLREYFGDEHFQKYVTGEIASPETSKVDSWQLDPSQYKSEPAEEGPNFDADIFANAARSTLETNPEAIVQEPPREEITGPPPDPSWAVPSTFDGTPAKSENAFEAMLAAGSEGASAAMAQEPEAATAEAEAEPNAVPNLSILDALPTPTNPAIGTTSRTSNTSLPQMSGPAEEEVAADSMSPAAETSVEPQQNSLFNHLTADSERNPLQSGAMWSAVSPGESLFAAPEEEDTPTAEPVEVIEPTIARAANESLPDPAQTAAQVVSEAAPIEAPAVVETPVVESSAVETPVAETAASEAPAADVQQPRVRPRGYSSPYRSKTQSLSNMEPVAPPPGPSESSQNLAAMSAPAAEQAPEPVAESVAEPVVESVVEAAPEPTAPPSVGTSSSTNTTALPFRPRPASSPRTASGGTSDSLATPSLPSTSPSTSGSAAAAAGSQDARLMMNEMTSLMSKLEMQVAKAANKMASRAEELRGRLSQQVDGLVKEAQELEKQAEGNLSTLASELKFKLDNLATDVQTGLARDAQNAQVTVEDIAQEGWDRLESEQNHLATEIERSANEFRTELDKLTSTVTTRLERLIESRNRELATLSDNILAQLKESHDQYNVKVQGRYERFEQRMNEETGSISSSLDRNMRSMVEEIETSLERACEKLKNTKFELEQTVAHTIAVSEMAIAQKAKHLLTETLLPRLNEQKEIIRTMISDMSKQITNESNSGLDAETAKLEQGTNHAATSLRRVAEECVQEVEMTGRGIKTGLEDHFKRVSSDLMVRTREVGDKIRETERRMADSEYALKHLAEASTVENEPELADERNHAVSKLATLKAEASKELANNIEQNLESLEGKGETLISELSNKRSDLTSQVRESSETHLSKVRQALQEATSAIQSAREKHME